MREASIKLGWKQKHLDKLETLGWILENWKHLALFNFGPRGRSSFNYGNFKELYSNLNNIQPLYLRLHTLRNILENSNSLDHISAIERASFKLGYRTIWANLKSVIQICIYCKYLSKLQQPKSKLDQLKQLHSNLGRVRNILKSGTYSGNPPFQLALIFVPQIVDGVKGTTDM